MQYTTDELKAILEKHGKWVRNEEGGERANLQRADLEGANLQGANLDYSCLPLWCGGSRFKADARLVRQILAHVVTIEMADADEGLKAAIEAIKAEARKSHRAGDLGILEIEE